MGHADAVLDGRFCSHALDGLDHDLLCLLVGVELRLVHDFVDVAGGSGLGLVFHRFDQTVLGLICTQARHLFEHLALLELHLLQLLGLHGEQALLVFEALLLGVELTALTAQFLLTLVERELALLQFVLSLLSLLVTLLDFLLELALLVEELLLYLQLFFLLDNLGLFLGGLDPLIVFPLQYVAENQISANTPKTSAPAAIKSTKIKSIKNL